MFYAFALLFIHSLPKDKSLWTSDLFKAKYQFLMYIFFRKSYLLFRLTYRVFIKNTQEFSSFKFRNLTNILFKVLSGVRNDQNRAISSFLSFLSVCKLRNYFLANYSCFMHSRYCLFIVCQKTSHYEHQTYLRPNINF